MPRAHGRILFDIWDDEEFIARSGLAQRLYLFLLSQADLNFAGLIPLRVKRWAKKIPDSDAAGIERDLAELEAHRFVLTDDDTEELLVRTLVRNDGIYKQPKVMLRMREDAKQMTSKRLRAAFLAEVERIPLAELSDAPGGRDRDQPSTREVVAGVVDTLREDFADVAEYPSERVWGRVSDTPSEGSAEESPIPPVYARARSPFPQPPSPSPHPRSAATPLPLAPLDGAAPGTDLAIPSETPAKRAQRLTRTYTDQVKLANFPAIMGVVKKAMGAGYDDDTITGALARLAESGRSVTTETLRIEIEGMPARPSPKQQQTDDLFARAEQRILNREASGQ